MGKKTAKTPGRAARGYWEKRFRTKAFRQNLTACIASELADLATQPVGEVVDTKRIRKWIRSWKLRDVDRALLEKLVVHLGGRFENRVGRTESSLRELLDPDLTEGVEAILAEDLVLSRTAEDFIAEAVRQEFVHQLLVDVIHTAIVSFNKRVNPLFAGLTAMVLEDQIRGFIGLFMPMLQDQVVAFATSKSNQRVLLDFARSIVRQLLDEPMKHFTSVASPAQRRQVEALVGRIVRSPKLESVVRDALMAAWDDGYERIRRRKVGDVVDLERYGPRLAAQLVDLMLPVLSRSNVLLLIAEETATAAGR